MDKYQGCPPRWIYGTVHKVYQRKLQKMDQKTKKNNDDK